MNRKDDPLLALLRSVYVDSTDPAPAEVRRGHRDMLGSILLSQSHTIQTANYCFQNLPRVKLPFYWFWLLLLVPTRCICSQFLAHFASF